MYFSIVLVAAAVIVIFGLVLANSQADTATTSATITNANPSVTGGFVSTSANGGSDDFGSGVTLNAGSTLSMHVNGTVFDDNGSGDISSVSVVAFRSGATGGTSCTADNNDCYIVSSCTLTANDATTLNYNCEVPLEFYADPTDSGTYSAESWDFLVTVTDSSAGTGSIQFSSVSKDVEVNSLLSLDIPATIAYGSFAPGDNLGASEGIQWSLENQGNVAADIQVSGTDMTCTTGTIAIANQEYSDTDSGFDTVETVKVSTTPTNYTDLVLPARTNDGAALTDDLFWFFEAPTNTGIDGTCSGTNTVTAIAA